jgi:type IX secretion system PorP/SprF family membrane protein|tara:strand:- start:12563 stop:13516 length:954 start_codon:yes stop_codon:yes gene_type:complete
MKNLLTLFLAILTLPVMAQQISLNSQYMFNESSFNSGAVGSKPYTQIQLNGRRQWSGFQGSPTTQQLSVNGYLGNNLGMGGVIFNDVTGPSRRTGFVLSGAYRLRLSRDNNHKLGMGMGVSLTQHFIDINRLTTFLPNDPAVAEAYNNQLVPDVNAGLYYTFKDKGFAGLSVQNMVQSNRNLFDFNQTFVNPVVRNYYAYGGYKFDLKKKWTLTPTAMVRMIDALAMQFDISTIATYNNLLWIGASFRYKDAVCGLIGVQLGVFKFGYSYDYTLSDIGKYSNGSHEIFLELQLFPKKGVNRNIQWLKRNRLYTPSTN